MAQPTGEQVRILKTSMGDECAGVIADVESRLSIQFTARYTDGSDTITFRFYKDEGDTWENVT